MKLEQIITNLEGFCPLSFAQGWDNVGLQTGRTASDITTVCLCEDATSAVIDEARHHGAQLLVTHPHAHQFLLLQKPQTWAHITIPEGVTQEAMHFHLRSSRIYSGRSLSSRAESGPWGP